MNLLDIEEHFLAFQLLMEKYSPWGRKGGGAPNETIRITNLLEKGIFPEPFNDIRNYVATPKFRSCGGGGAPRRSATGKIITVFRDDPQLSFNTPTRNVVDIELRYKTSDTMKSNYKLELGENNLWFYRETPEFVNISDKLVEEKRIQNAATQLEPLPVEPWGRQGPGGSPWRPPKNIGCQFMQSMGWTDQKLLRSMDSETHSAFRNPYEKIPQTANLKRIKEDARRPLPCCNVCSCCCYLRKQINSQPKPNTPQAPPSTAVVEETNSIPNPVKPSQETKPRPRIKRECHADYVGPAVSEEGRQLLSKPMKHKDFRSRSYMISEGVELVPLLAKRRAQQKSTSLSTTDVTKYREPALSQDYGIQYLSDLCKQMKRKQRETDVRT